MFVVLASALIGYVYGQDVSCEYQGGPNNKYSLNLTSIFGWRLEYKSPHGFDYIYTPCFNNEQCVQGNARYYANSVQYKIGSNECYHYLSVDRHQQPTYFYGGASWLFQYTDGQLCDVTQQPRDLNVWMLCDENFDEGAFVADVVEDTPCSYSMQIRTPLACVPESKHHANCQWKATSSENTTVYLDLSSENGNYYRGGVSTNGYEIFYSPCQNGLHCYQQFGQQQVMSIAENMVTHTCEQQLSEWQEGRVEPIFHDSNPDEIHWSFHYWLSQKCLDGTPGEQTIRWYCDENAVNSTVKNATYDGNCRWEINMLSQEACPSSTMYSEHQGLVMDMKELYQRVKQHKLQN